MRHYRTSFLKLKMAQSVINTRKETLTQVKYYWSFLMFRHNSKQDTKLPTQKDNVQHEWQMWGPVHFQTI